jgi:hypothetical protein
LKSYGTEKQLTVKGPTKKTEKTGSKCLWYFLEHIQAMKATKVCADIREKMLEMFFLLPNTFIGQIVWPRDDEWDANFVVSCDGVHASTDGRPPIRFCRELRISFLRN